MNKGTKGEETRQRILELAAPVFNTKGYAGASLADILEATGLQKGGLYNHFDSKEDLALAAFDWSISQIGLRWKEVTRGKTHSIDYLVGVVDLFNDYDSRPIVAGGCPILNTAIESDDANPMFRERAQKAMEGMRTKCLSMVEMGVERGEIRPNVDAANLVVVVISLIEGGIMMSKLFGDSSLLKTAQEHARKLIRNERLN